MVKGITANSAVFSRERISGITFLANFQFFSFVQTQRDKWSRKYGSAAAFC